MGATLNALYARVSWPGLLGSPSFSESYFHTCQFKSQDMSQNQKKASPAKRARRQRQRLRKRAIRNGAQPARKSVRQSNMLQPVGRRQRNRRRGGPVNSPMGMQPFPDSRRRGSILSAIDVGGAGWEEASGMIGQAPSRGIQRSRKEMVIEESEFVAAVTVANQPNFNNVAFPINPGQASLFPWLSTIAKQFEKYQFEKLAFVFKKEVSEFATAGQTGKVMMMVDFDASDAPPVTKQQMEDTDPHNDAMPSQTFSLILDPVDMVPWNLDARYIRPGGLPGAADIKTYDLGNLNVATQGITANSEVGELHVVYKVRLIKPILENLAGAPANNQVSWFRSNAAQTFTTATPTTSLNANIASGNGLAIVNTAGSFVPPAGNYLIDFGISAVDSANEIFQLKVDILKNAATVYPNIAAPPQIATPGNGTANLLAAEGCVFVTANGTDAFTETVTLTGAAGVLTAWTNIRWTAV